MTRRRRLQARLKTGSWRRRRRNRADRAVDRQMREALVVLRPDEALSLLDEMTLPESQRQAAPWSRPDHDVIGDLRAVGAEGSAWDAR